MGLIIDNFAGGGGASTAIHLALGRHPDYAINHDPVALSVHKANHPTTDHLVNDIRSVNPDDVAKGRPVDLIWFSPDCKHHSKAKGGKPLDKEIRDLAWVAIDWVKKTRPRIIFLENVEEFEDWCPLLPDGKPDTSRKGETFKRWVKALRDEGYVVEWRLLKACDYGAPTIRKRLFLVARRDGQPIVWPKPTHGPANSLPVTQGRLLPYRSAADVIDFSLPCPSIFDTRAQIKEKFGLQAIRPLADNTLARIAKGIQRYVVEAEEPYFVTYAQHGGRNRSAADPMHTITASRKDYNGVVCPTFEPATMESASKVAAFMAQHNTGVVGHSVKSPVSTITGRGTQQQLVAVHMQDMHGSSRRMQDITDPLGTICAGGNHKALVAAFMQKYYGNGGGQSLNDPMHTLTTKDRMGLVTVNLKDMGEFVITDIGMRMLTNDEQFAAQGFPADYINDRGADGEAIKRTDSTRLCGNSVSPHPARALIAANCPDMIDDSWNNQQYAIAGE